MQASQTPRKPRAKRPDAAAEILHGIARARETDIKDPASVLAYVSGWIESRFPKLAAELDTLARDVITYKRD